MSSRQPGADHRVSSAGNVVGFHDLIAAEEQSIQRLQDAKRVEDGTSPINELLDEFIDIRRKRRDAITDLQKISDRLGTALSKGK